ncbi:MAG: hypothetical protein CFE21_15385 [Bacteroidetes bacterium B1(2017)]|nr:MAG: hypothetical protein CFE21_15385 [Bacteroidetes bacterium B1(2017)]
MKNLKLLLITAMVLLYAKSAQSSCNASFTYAISGLTVTFTNTSTTTSGFPNMMMYNWSFGDGTYSTVKNPVKTYATGGVKGIQLFINDSFGCTHLAIDTFILVNPTPTCNASYTKLITGGSGFTVAFTNTSASSSSSNAIRYSWNFYNYNYTDTITSSLKNPTITFTNGGIKYVRLTMYDSISSCTATKMDSIILYNGLACQALFGKTISNLNVTLNNNSINAAYTSSGLNYLWQFSDGTTSTTPSPVKTFATGGMKTIRLTIQDSAHFCTHTKIDTVILTAPVSCTASFTKTITGLSVAFTNTSTSSSGSSAIRYNWYFSDGTSSNLKNPTKLFTSGGVKSARLSLYDSISSCTDTTLVTFILSSGLPPCSANFYGTKSGLSVTLNNLSLNSSGTSLGLTYKWTFSDMTSSTQKNLTKTFATGGYKTIQLDITDSINPCTASARDSFILSGNSCQANFTKTISGLTVTLNNTSLNGNGNTAGLSYSWGGTFPNTTQKNPIITFSNAGLQVIGLFIYDSITNCTSSKSDTFNLVAPTPLCSASFALAIDTTTPFNFFLLNTSLIRPGSSFYWTFGDGGSSTSMTPTHAYSTFGKYLVCLTVSDSVCTSTYCDSIGMDSLGNLLKKGGFSFRTLDYTKLTGATGLVKMAEPMKYFVYPNPSAGELNVEVNLREATPLNFELMDISGKILATKNIGLASGNYKESLDLSELKPSIYFLSIRSNQGVSTFKVIKN